jgi:hypothetical protein
MVTPTAAHPAGSSSPSVEDRAAVRLRVAHLLNTASLDAAWMPPASTLILRKFHDPLPRELCKEESPLIASRDWENAVQSALREQFQRALRPAREMVTASANAVLFETAAELMACLARDLCTGDALVRWWWRSYVRGAGITLGSALAATFRREPRCIPAAMAKLTEWEEAERVISQLSPQQAELIFGEVLHVYRLPGLAAALHPESRPTSQTELPKYASASSALRSFDDTPETVATPWEPMVSAALTPIHLGMPRRALLGVTLLLARAPHRARTAQFERSFKRWVIFAAQSAGSPDVNKQPESGFAPQLQATSVPRVGVIVTKQAHPQEQRSTPPPLSGARISIQRPVAKQSITQLDKTTSVAQADIQAADSRSFAPPEFDLQGGIATQLGGILFLIPFLRALDFFGRLESNFHLENPPSPWALVELFARCLMGRVPTTLNCDPAWVALRTLDGRSAIENPAHDFVGAEEFHLPHPWVQQWVKDHDELLTFSLRGKRLLVRHPQGFPMLDSMLAENLAQPVQRHFLDQLAEGAFDTWRFGKPDRATRRRISSLSCEVPAMCRSNPALVRFLQFFSPFFRWALTNALSEGPRRTGDPVSELLRRPGWLYVTSTHVDLVMDMNSVSLGVRLAGLDANPGWVPELGRVIAFHYR